MTMINAYFRLPNRPELTVEEIQDRLREIHETTIEADELPTFNGSIGATERTIRIYLHVSEMADLKETMEKGVGAELILAW